MIVQKTKFLIFTFLVISLNGFSQSKNFPETEKLDTYLKAIHLKKSFSGEILVAMDSVILYQQTVGLASIENNVEITKGAKYNIASITKTFTGTLITIAQEEGKLNVQDKAINYINGLSSKFKEITIKQLLNHISGLPHDEGIEDYWLIKSKLQMTIEQAIAEINNVDLLFKPGSEMSYSSLGYFLLAIILEKVYHDDYQNIFQTKILGKLKMTETGTANTLKIIPQMTSGYHLINDDSLVVAPYRNYSMLKGAGDMISNSTDLLKWNNSFFSNTLLSEETKDLIFSKSEKVFKQNGEHYGFGWYIDEGKPVKYYHGGGTWGFSTYNAFYPDEKISIIILSNVSTLPVTSIAADVEKIVYRKPFEMPSIEKVVSTEDFNLENYCGKFIADSNKMLLTITKLENNLYAQLAGRPPFEIYPKGNHQFFGKKVEIEFTFDVENDKAILLKAEGMGQVFYFKKQN